jgi:hypothetical protein
MSAELQSALDLVATPPELPWPLPLAHLSIARWFEAIATGGRLEPCSCKVFGEKLLYFSYGGVFYRPKNLQTQNASELPIAFVFDPSLIELTDAAYPFDTGAVYDGRFGPEWTRKLSSFRSEFRVHPNGDPYGVCRLIYHLFGTNLDYLRGEPAASCGTKPPPLPLLCEFLSADLSGRGIDHRQRTVECLARTEVALGRTLLWIGFPDLLGRDFITICRRTKPWVPQFFAYAYHKNFNPAQIAASLEQEAMKLIDRFASAP